MTIKRRAQYRFAIAMAFIAFFSCKPEEEVAKECGDDVTTLLNVINAHSLFASDTVLFDGDDKITHYWSTIVDNGIRHITIGTVYTNLCTYENPFIVTELQLTTADPSITDTVRIWEENMSGVEYISEDHGQLRNSGEFYVWSDDYDGTQQLTYQYTIYFPSVDWPTDSTYFFSNMSSMIVSMSGKGQK